MVTRESVQTVLTDVGRCYDMGWSDGLPVVPPYRYLVDEMLDALGWDGGEIVGRIAAQRLDITARHLAATAVMAGCLPDYAAVLRPLSELLVDPGFNISGVEVTTGGPAALVVVSGPIVSQLGFEHGPNAVGGANARPNATIGRYANLVRLFCGRGGGVLQPSGTMGHPGRYSFCIAEHPTTEWGPFHTQLGLSASASAVSIMAAEGPNSVNNHYAAGADQILETIASCLSHSGFTNWYWHFGACIVVIGPAHAETISATYSREEARHVLFEKSRRMTDELAGLGRIPTDPREKSNVEFGAMRSPFDHESQIHLLESGAEGGRFSAVIPGWVGDYTVMTREIA